MPLKHNFRVDTVSALTLVAFLDAESQNLHQIASHCAMSPVILGFRGSKLCTSMFAVWSRKVASASNPSPSAMNSSSQNTKRLDVPQEMPSQTSCPH